MHLKMAGNIFAFLMFMPLFVTVTATGIPAILWNNALKEQYPVSLAGHTLDTESFYKGYLQQLTENTHTNIAVFIQDQLSVEDITRYADVFNDASQGAVFTSVRDIMENYDSTYLANIEAPTSAVDKLLELFHGNTLVVNGEDLQDGGIDLNENEANFVLVNLPKTAGAKKLQGLVSSDEVIGRVTRQLAAAGQPFAAIYTAKEKTQEPVVEVFAGRHLLQSEDPAENYTFFNVSGCLFMYFTQLQLHVLRYNGKKVEGEDLEKNKYTLPHYFNESAAVITDSTCIANSSATLVVKYPDADLPENLEKFEMTMTFKLHMRYWLIDVWNLTYSAKWNGDSGETFQATNEPMVNNNQTVFGVVGYAGSSTGGTSYHCNSSEPIKQYTRKESSENIVQLGLTGWQLQFDVRGDQFGKAEDCIGFFSAAIWMGLISTLVLLLVVSFGIGMLANINTMDRFDDPKGKNIQVNVMD